MRLVPGRRLRILDFDCETRATGFGDPNWVPQEVTAIAWSWVGEEEIFCRLRCRGAKTMLRQFRRAYDEADVVTGHNIRRFDLPILNAEHLRFGIPSLGQKTTEDTLRDLVRTKGMKRDQDNLIKAFGFAEKKIPMSWQDWQDAYAERGWPQIEARVVSDVRSHKLMRAKMIEREWLRFPSVWSA